jgi:hypothetical protein
VHTSAAAPPGRETSPSPRRSCCSADVGWSGPRRTGSNSGVGRGISFSGRYRPGDLIGPCMARQKLD